MFGFKEQSKNIAEQHWPAWVDDGILPLNFEDICCCCGNEGPGLTKVLLEFNFFLINEDYMVDVLCILEKQPNTLVPVEPPWDGCKEAETLLVPGVLVACYTCCSSDFLIYNYEELGKQIIRALNL